MEILIFWVVLCAIVGAIASGKGKNGALFFFAALLLSPLLVGIYALVMSSEPKAAPVPANAADELTKLVALHDAGQVTDEEYTQMRAGLVPASPTAPAAIAAPSMSMQAALLRFGLIIGVVVAVILILGGMSTPSY